MTDHDLTSTTIEVWKKIIDVQMHFNDLCLRIRALALTALTFTYGATFVTLEKAIPIKFPSVHGKHSPATIVALIGLILWIAFWFIDAHWYHRLLRGAVAEGKELEAILGKHGIYANLTVEIEKASQIHNFPKLGIKNKKIRAGTKLNYFYGISALPLLILAIFIWNL